MPAGQPARPQQRQVRQDHEDQHQIDQACITVPPYSRTKARADSVAAPTSNCGTRSSRSRAIVDSIDPHDDRQQEHAIAATTPSQHEAGDRPARDHAERDERPDDQHAEQPELQRAVQDEGEVGPAVVEHHDLVDHRQFEVGVRVVDRNAGVLGQEDHDSETATSTRVSRAALQSRDR